MPLVYQNKKYPNFEVSNTGKLRNVKTGTIYRQYKNHQGYYQVCVSLGGRLDKKVFKIHRAVAETFVPLVEGKDIINHKDGNKTNNFVDNLEWVTNQENIIHAVKTGLLVPKSGTQNPCAKLTEDDIEYIRSHYIPKDKKYGCRALGEKFNVSHATISRVVNYKRFI